MANWDQIKGSVNEAAGELTNDQYQKLKGYLQKFKGDGKELSENSLKAIAGAINAKIEEYKNNNAKNN